MVGWARTLLLAAALRAAEDPHLARLRQAAQLQNDGRLSEAVPIYEDVCYDKSRSTRMPSTCRA